METMKDVLCFLNEFDFVDKLHNLENLARIKKMLVGELEDYNMSKLLYALNIIGEIKLSDVTKDFVYCLE